MTPYQYRMLKEKLFFFAWLYHHIKEITKEIMQCVVLGFGIITMLGIPLIISNILK